MMEHRPLISRFKHFALSTSIFVSLVGAPAHAEEGTPPSAEETSEAHAIEPKPEYHFCHPVDVDGVPIDRDPSEACPEASAPRADLPPVVEEPTSELTYLSYTVMRLNPLGLQTQFDLDWKVRLYDPGESLIKSNNFFSIGVSPIISPALARLGVSAKFQPLAILKLEARWDYLSYFGNIDILQSFQDPGVDYSDTVLARRGDEGLNYGTDGWSLTLDGEARAKVGPVIVRNRFRAIYIDVDLQNDDRVLYDQYFDLLLPRQGWFFTNDADLLFQVTPKLIVGVRWAFMGVNYTADSFATSPQAPVAAESNHRTMIQAAASTSRPSSRSSTGTSNTHPGRGRTCRRPSLTSCSGSRLAVASYLK